MLTTKSSVGEMTKVKFIEKKMLSDINLMLVVNVENPLRISGAKIGQVTKLDFK